MKTLDETSNDKLRGGFYTPLPLVNVCLDRIARLNGQRADARILEPSVGDGAFLRGLAAHPLSANVKNFVGIEITDSEAKKCRELGHLAPFNTAVVTGSAIDWATATEDWFDVVLGNPPFVRYQFIPASDAAATVRLGERLQLPFRGVSNLWIPVLLGALDRLRPGGSMALVVPAEIFTGVSAGDARAWLLKNFSQLRVDMFEPGSFPAVLQEVIVISGRRVDKHRRTPAVHVKFVEHFKSGGKRRWSHLVPKGTQSWTRYLLTSAQLDALSEARSLSSVRNFGEVAKLEVSIVTGANDFFSVTTDELRKFELHEWAVPLLPRIRHAKGLAYTLDDHEATAATAAKAWLLNFSENHRNPELTSVASQYLTYGERRGLHLRYKTSIRAPWYRLPSVRAGKLMMSKRSHRFPRLVFNAADVVTTDTIYRGNILPEYRGRELELAAAFHNSLTLLTVELEGRSFGGGVLELVPSEIARLAIPFPAPLRDSIPRLDRIARHAAAPEQQDLLIEETDALLCRRIPGLTRDLMHRLRGARESLANRRLTRN